MKILKLIDQWLEEWFESIERRLAEVENMEARKILRASGWKEISPGFWRVEGSDNVLTFHEAKELIEYLKHK